MKFVFILVSFLTCFVHIDVLNALEIIWKVDGLSSPESVIYHKKSDSLYVSNINGKPLEEDGNGYISKLNSNGKYIKKKWVTGLDAPKGLAIFGDYLFVADINKIWKISLTDKTKKFFKVHNTGFLNDLVADKTGSIYASDMFKNVIYRLKDNKIELWKKSEMLFSPNGLLIDKKNLIVACWGKRTEGFKTEIPGYLIKVNLKNRKISKFFSTRPIGNLDGIVFNKGRIEDSFFERGYFVTDWVKGKLFSVNNKGISRVLLDINKGSADLEIIMHKNVIIIPMMLDNNIIAYKLK